MTDDPSGGTDSYRRFLAGDSDAFGELYRLYKDNLIYFMYRHVRNYAIAEDLAAETFARLLAEPERYNFSVSLKTYLFTIGRNLALNRIKREGRIAFTDFKDNEAAADVSLLEDIVVSGERKRRVNQAVNRLREDYRTAIYLIYFEEMSYEEAGRVMKKSRKQIDNLVFRAKAALRKDLAEGGQDLL